MSKKYKTIINYYHPWFDRRQSKWESEENDEEKSLSLEFIYNEYVSDFQCLFSCEDDYVEITKITKRKIVESIYDDEEEQVIFEDKKWKEGYTFSAQGDFQYDVYFQLLKISENKKRKFSSNLEEIPEKKHKTLLNSIAEQLEEACHVMKVEYKCIQDAAKSAIASGEVNSAVEWNQKNKHTCQVFQTFHNQIGELQNLFDRASGSKELNSWMFKLNSVTKNSYILFPVVPKKYIFVNKKKVSWNWKPFSGEKPTTWPLFDCDHYNDSDESEEVEKERPVYYSPKYEGWIVSLRHKKKLLQLGAEEYRD